MGFLGGAIASGVPHKHYFSDDPTRDLQIVARLIDEHGPRTILGLKRRGAAAGLPVAHAGVL